MTPMAQPLGLQAMLDQPKTIAVLIKEGQRRSVSWKEAWVSYCEQYGGGRYDPNRHEESFLVGFLELAGACVAEKLGIAVQPPQQPQQQQHQLPPGKRQRTSSAGSGYAGSGYGYVDPSASAALVDQVKSFQRQGKECKDVWVAFCDQNLQGVYDPARHDSTVLQQFLESQGTYSSGSYSTAYSPPASQQLVGMNDPGRQELVDQVKAFQKLGKDHTEEWRAYCDVMGSRIYDPARHESQLLYHFLETKGLVEGGVARVSPAGAPMSMALGSPEASGTSAGSMNMNAMNMGMAMGMSPGGGSHAGSSAENALVEQVKAWQRMGEAQTQQWRAFCDEHLSGIYNPARHDPSALQLFVDTVSNGATAGS
mmetsp:Transcript_43824/g.95415  ORF Transcript_43824/g.95415 Transcript_43824/m.95415 type:complete len:367 (+) Transcript_43824:27-1127(+)